MIDTKQRLKIYKKALWSYRLGNFLELLFGTSDNLNGLNHYFYIQLSNENRKGDWEEQFPEINLEVDYTLDQPYLQMPGGKGEWKDEIEVLKRAIKLTKFKIKHGQ